MTTRLVDKWRRAFVLSTGAAVLTAAVSLTGCGGSKPKPTPKPTPVVSSEQKAILETIDSLQSASRQGNAGKICKEIFTETLAKSIRSASKHSCEKEVRTSLTSPQAEISVGRKIDIKGSRATALVQEQNGNRSTISLVKEAGRWRIERIRPVGK